MIQGYIEKGYTPTETDLEKIRKFTQKDFDLSELFVFNLVLCSNDIDRDWEKFSTNALLEMQKLFIGKTGIKDHSMKAADQTARIFDACVEPCAGKSAADGEQLYFLKAKAYMVKSGENAALIKEIEAGIKKEVSVSCAVKKSSCSICGKDKNTAYCGHIPGREYDGRLCYFTLDDITDAYEWSFVAVPAQRDAGVTKSFAMTKGEHNMESIEKRLKAVGEEIVISKSEAEAICSFIDETKELSELGREYKSELVRELTALFKKCVPLMDMKIFEGVASVMTTKELLAFKGALKKQLDAQNMPSPQLVAGGKQTQRANLSEFKI
ncbi:MAG: hypothetical protein LUH82_05105 [Clostridiales bacterium]|nr:hypothetical protein [Clostridiales bacterium]